MRVACLGDSLTQCRALEESRRWPVILEKRLGCKFDNYGIYGDSTAGILARTYPVLSSGQYTHCFVLGGTNDFWFSLSPRQAVSNVYSILKQAVYLGITPVLGIPPLLLPPEDPQCPEMFHPVDGYEVCQAALKEYRELIHLIARFEQVPCVDLQEAFLDKETGLSRGELFLEDGIHFNDAGSAFVADVLTEVFQG